MIENKFLDLLAVKFESHFHFHLYLQAAWPPRTYVYTRGITYKKYDLQPVFMYVIKKFNPLYSPSLCHHQVCLTEYNRP